MGSTPNLLLNAIPFMTPPTPPRVKMSPKEYAKPIQSPNIELITNQNATLSLKKYATQYPTLFPTRSAITTQNVYANQYTRPFMTLPTKNNARILNTRIATNPVLSDNPFTLLQLL